MAAPARATTVVEQNTNTIAGVQTDTNVYATAATGGVTIRFGREAPTYIMAGTQTASMTQVVLDLVNAAAGDKFVIKKYTTALLGTGLAQIGIFSGSGAGALVGALGTAVNNFAEVTAVFDGVAWR